jgi:phosphoribosylanthranilate isomerase
MNVLVKICGITTAEALEAAVSAGADAVGFVFHRPSPRNLSAAGAARLAASLPPGVRKVAVTLHPAQSLVDEVLAALAPDAWQTDARDFDSLRLPTIVERWPVCRSGARPPEPLPSRLLFEGSRSGRGEVADWPVAAGLAARAELILGGGLTPANVAAAIATVRPFGVDVSSGVESAPGRKDPARIVEFVAAAREAAAGVNR